MQRKRWLGDTTLGALRRLGERLGEDLLRQVVESFLTEGRRGLATMRGALAAGDAAALATAAHALAGAAAMLRAFALESCCAELETRARQGDLAAAGALVPVVAYSYTRVAAELAASAGEALFQGRPAVAQGEEGQAPLLRADSRLTPALFRTRIGRNPASFARGGVRPRNLTCRPRSPERPSRRVSGEAQNQSGPGE